MLCKWFHFFLLITFLLTSSPLHTCISFQMTHGTASSSSKAPADRSASADDGAHASKKVRHFLKELYIILFCYSLATFLLFRLAQICAQPPTHKQKHTRSFSCGKSNLQPTGPMRPKRWEKCCKLFYIFLLCSPGAFWTIPNMCPGHLPNDLGKKPVSDPYVR